MEMTFEQIEDRWRQITGLSEAEGNGLSLLPFHEQIQVCCRAFEEEVDEKPQFSPMVWTATFLGVSGSVWQSALSVEGGNETDEEHTEEALMAFMEHADPAVEYVWRGVLHFLDDLDVSPELILKGLSLLERISREFLAQHENDGPPADNDLEAIDLADRTDRTRIFVRFGLPEFRRRLDAWSEACEG